MKVANMMGHSTRTLVLGNYGGWIPEDEGGTANNLPEKPSPAQRAESAALNNVVSFR
jgi:integrase